LITTERVLRLLEPAYASDLTPRSLEELRAMHDESAQAELALSYYRRLAQARIEILEAEEARRASGGSVEDLIADLPNILGAESRSTVATTRGAPSADAPTSCKKEKEGKVGDRGGDRKKETSKTSP